MKICVFDAKTYDKQYFDEENKNYRYKIKYHEAKLSADTAMLAKGYDIVCPFVNDDINAEVIETLHQLGVKAIAMRCAGYNNVDVRAAFNKLPILRVPRYSPYAVAEHAMALLLTLNRRIHRAYIRTRDSNFALTGLLGFDLHGKTAGVIGTGQIGRVFIDICKGFGMNVLAYDPFPAKNSNFEYVQIDEIFKESDILSLHCPLTPQTHHIVNEERLQMMKPSAIIVNTSRGALINSADLIEALKANTIAGAALDVYEEESDVFFEDFSDKVIQDDRLSRLLSFNNVIITSHQAFFTREALQKIAQVTFENFRQVKDGEYLQNEVCYRCGTDSNVCHKRDGKNCFDSKTAV
ncbi:MAG: 2-hydroxyacid dehydrogenase [Bradymonadales bacterium]|jgi:D-lactate dehydrogenase